MVNLRPLRQEEFAAYCDYFIADYAQEMVSNYGYPLADARLRAEQELQHAFPAGPEHGAHTLLCIEVEVDQQPQVAGYLWHCLQPAEQTTFIYDVYVADAYRGAGVGKQAFALLEQQLHAQGIQQIKLRVAYHNPRALKLYQTLGFVITGYNMSKQIS